LNLERKSVKKRRKKDIMSVNWEGPKAL
jgi:hypothetical protein